MTETVPSTLAPGTAQRGPGGWHRALLPAGLTVGGTGAALAVHQVFDPFRQDIPLCITYRLTGIYCPGCGATRCVHALLDGDLLLAAQNNALILFALPIVAAVLALWTVRRVQGRTLRMPSARTILLIAAVVLVYAVLRNLPAFSFLAPTSLIGA